MAKVFPCTPHSSSERERYTVWLKSLVLNGNGCTVFDSNGQIAYRVDNYESKCSNQIYLMDIQGNVICAILRKKWQLYGCWNGYSCDDPKMKNEKPWFQVRRQIKLLKGGSVYHVTVKRDPAQASFYKIEGVARKLVFKITDLQQRLMAEARESSVHQESCWEQMC
ncbi:hypothetical protein NMG60_11027124 [Bertholletia excelsa]